jgi:phenylalanyl-tRNA synthetase alpha chain
MEKIEEIKKNFLLKIKKAKSLKELDLIFNEYLGKGGKISVFFKKLKDLPIEKRKILGKKLNFLKEFFEKEIEKKKKIFFRKKEKEIFDITLPPKKIERGHLHPLTQTKRKVEEIFTSFGFEVVEGPEIEDEWHNFDALNMPPWHPARDVLSLGKTFYLKEKGYLLRSHTSAVQIRYLETHNPPFKIIVPGRVFRAESTDASHEIDFWQLEGLMVQKETSLANFKAVIEEFFKRFFEKQIKVRLRPSYFPFVEPGVEVDISCPICQMKGCSVCKQSGFIEVAGAGMVHPFVFKAVKLNPREWQGFAFGFGLTRLAMIKYKISDIRYFNSGDLRFLKQF